MQEVTQYHFEFDVPFGIVLCLFILVVGGLITAYTYRSSLGALSSRTKGILTALRTAAVVLILLMLLRPSFVGKEVKPGEQTILMLLDDSKSMRVQRDTGQTRGQALLDVLQQHENDFESSLRNKYRLVSYRFGEGIERIQSLQNLTFNQNSSDLVGAIQESLQEWQNQAVSGVILFSDGAQHPSRSLAEVSQEILRDIPIFTVGVDREGDWNDIAVQNLKVRKTHFDQSPLIVNAEIEIAGLTSGTVIVDILEKEKVAQTDRIRINPDKRVYPVRFQFIPREKGWVEYSVRARLDQRSFLHPTDEAMSASSLDQIAENNLQSFLVDNNQNEYKILYVSGRPNWEHKFVRRALLDDPQLKLTSLIRISAAERKFVFRGANRSSMANPLFDRYSDDADTFGRYDEAVYLRLGAKEGELKSGFPSMEDELFRYHLVIIGETEKDFFTTEQLDLLRDFVSERGGSLLCLGGPLAFEQGGYSNSLLDSLLPNVMSRVEERDFQGNRQRPFRVTTTIEGELAGGLSLETDPDLSQKYWGSIPPLYGLHTFALTRAGATTWAKAKSEFDDLDEQPFFVMQRYGHGRTAILAAAETWPWHMDTKEEPSVHERIWRQMIRSLVNDVPKQSLIRFEKDTFPVGKTIPVAMKVRDLKFNDREGLRVTMNVATSTGQTYNLPVDESIQETGLYTSEWIPEDTGTHRLSLLAIDEKEEVVGQAEEAILVEADQEEWKHSKYNPAFLQNISQETKGKFFDLDNLAGMLDELPWKPSEDAKEVRVQLWHNPLFFLLLPLLFTAEWWIRRKKGRA